ncbi:MAG: acyl-CoA dehydrogenase family protein [Paeniglutamicibacter terrestris]|uniref:Dibenzothiophene monooxygenase n=1 Tax=Paeniglutamicibacter terrestris TaxID=2723403 RepID=A0ABX1G4K2_9MICC|nr:MULTISPECIES: acyl-CoA dehydrogenase family protein [Paeniglutamicibacter]ASN40685.1 acyl-CoA dehydrogenase [Arthrobacter sp. 7749]NKG21178.1 acyl-CoA dehydrogenase [Paeniglutamicibacter terrestris]QXQ10589.1 acyl-CoA dehydrogenase family protein [Paeniglutamicibacter sp. Y32M11]
MTATYLKERTDEARYAELSARFAPVFGRIAEGTVERESNHVLPFEPVKWLKEAGFTTLRVPVSHGGDPVSHEHLFRLIVELSAADSNVGHLLRSHFSFVETINLQPEEFRLRWFPRVLAGEIFGNAATEKGGNALGTTNTKLREENGQWLLKGEKYYTTGSIFADWVVVMASTEGVEGRQYAIVRADDPLVRIIDDWDGFGQPLTGTGTAIFDDVVVDFADIIQRKVSSTLEPAFFQLALLSVLAGIGRAALADAALLVRERTRTFNTGSGDLFRNDPLIQEKVGRIAAAVYAADSIVFAAARDLDAAVDPALGLDPTAAFIRAEIAVQQAHVSVPKLVLDATSELFDVTGASSVSRGKSLDRHWRNARTVATHNPVAFKARSVGDYYINGTIPTGLHSIGDAKDSTLENK